MGDEVGEVGAADAGGDPGDARALHAVAAGGLDHGQDPIGIRAQPRFQLPHRGRHRTHHRGRREARPGRHADGRVADVHLRRPVVHGGGQHEVPNVGRGDRHVEAVGGDRRPFAGRGHPQAGVGAQPQDHPRADRGDERIAEGRPVEGRPAAHPGDPAVEVRDPVSPREQPVAARRGRPERGGEGNHDHGRFGHGKDAPERDDDGLVVEPGSDGVSVHRHRAETERTERPHDGVELQAVDATARAVAGGDRDAAAQAPRRKSEPCVHGVLRPDRHAGAVDGSRDDPGGDLARRSRWQVRADRDRRDGMREDREGEHDGQQRAGQGSGLDGGPGRATSEHGGIVLRWSCGGPASCRAWADRRHGLGQPGGDRWRNVLARANHRAAGHTCRSFHPSGMMRRGGLVGLVDPGGGPRSFRLPGTTSSHEVLRDARRRLCDAGASRTTPVA